MIGVCSLLGIWVTVMVWYERRDKEHQAVLEGLAVADAASKIGDEEGLDGESKKMRAEVQATSA